MLNEDYTKMTQNFIFTDDEEIQRDDKSKTVVTDERQEAFHKTKFGLVKETPFKELLKLT